MPKKKLKLENLKVTSFLTSQESHNVKGRRDLGSTGSPYLLCHYDCDNPTLVVTCVDTCVDSCNGTCYGSCQGTCDTCGCAPQTPLCPPEPGTDQWHLCPFIPR